MVRYNIHLPEAQLENLRRIQKETGVTVAEQIRRAIDEYVGKSRKGAEK